MNSLTAAIAFLALISCAAPPPLNMERPSGVWVLERLDGPIARDLERPTISFDEGDRISGFAGCNRYFGQRASSPNAPAYFSGMGATKMACLGPAMDLEQRYLAGLGRTRDARVVDGRLVLFDANDQEIMRFAPGIEGAERTPPAKR